MQGVDPIDHLIITEVSEDEYNNSPLWFEIYNPTDTNINVHNYSLVPVGTDSSNFFVDGGIAHTAQCHSAGQRLLRIL